MAVPTGADEQGNPLLNKKGKTVLRPSYTVLQDDFFNAMQAAGYTDDMAPMLKNMEKLAVDFSEDPERILPQPVPLESAKAYREKKAKPLVQRMVKVLRSVYRAYLDLKSKYERLSHSYNKECARTASMREQIDALQSENRKLKETVSEYDLVKRSLGTNRIAEIVQAAKQSMQKKKHREHTR